MNATAALTAAITAAADSGSRVTIHGLTVSPKGLIQARDSKNRSYRIGRERAIAIIACSIMAA